MDLKETGCECSVHWQALVNILMNLLGPQKVRKHGKKTEIVGFRTEC
jgi:hypothetical protein